MGEEPSPTDTDRSGPRFLTSSAQQRGTPLPLSPTGISLRSTGLAGTLIERDEHFGLLAERCDDHRQCQRDGRE